MGGPVVGSKRIRRCAAVFVVLPLALSMLPVAKASLIQEVPAFAVFDDEVLSHGYPYYGYHGFKVYDAEGAPISGQFLSWTATVTGPNAANAGVLSGQLDQYGRGVFGYYATNPGVDTLVVSIGAATGSAERTYGLSDQNLVVRPAIRVEFDEAHTLRPTESYQYHGFTAYDVNNDPLTYSYNEWRATVSGVNGPLVFTGRLDSNGRGLFSYAAKSLEGSDVLEVFVDTANGDATRAYEHGDGERAGVFDAAVLESSDPLLEPTIDLNSSATGPGPGTYFYRPFGSSASENSDGVDSFFRYHG